MHIPLFCTLHITVLHVANTIVFQCSKSTPNDAMPQHLLQCLSWDGQAHSTLYRRDVIRSVLGATCILYSIGFPRLQNASSTALSCLQVCFKKRPYLHYMPVNYVTIGRVALRPTMSVKATFHLVLVHLLFLGWPSFRARFSYCCSSRADLIIASVSVSTSISGSISTALPQRLSSTTLVRPSHLCLPNHTQVS